MRELPLDHHCAWREEAEELRERLTVVEAQLEKLQRHVFGQRSEKMPPIGEELRRGEPKNRERTKARRQQNARVKRALPVRRIEHRVAEDKRFCPVCRGTKLRPLGTGRETTIFEHVPARVEQQVHVQEVLTCSCGEGIVTAEGAPKVVDKTQYGPGFLAHTIVAKVADSLPLYRQAKQYRRLGLPISRSTLTDLFHRGAEILSPLSQRLLVLVAAQPVVQADETVIRIQAKKKCRKGYLWTFLTTLLESGRRVELIGYRFSPSRSGDTPVEVLGNSKGTLVVDAYTGYNAVTTPDGRERAGCLAHARRRFFDALGTAPEAQAALDVIREIYRVEHEAADQGVVGTAAHLALRHGRSRLLMNSLETWLREQQPRHLPKGPLGEAISYALNNWPALCRFLHNAAIPVDNNASERALRVAALGRKNFLFVGSEQAGTNIAGLYALVATCEINGVNPVEYIADVLIRTQTHPNSRLDELLPHKWRPADKPPDEAPPPAMPPPASARHGPPSRPDLTPQPNV